MKSVICSSLLIFVMMALAACSRPIASTQPDDLAQRPINAVTTIGMIGDIVKNVGGERVKVTGLMGPGVDPHLYKASEGDVIRLGEADVVFYNGLHLEAAMSRVFERMGDRIKTVAVTDTIDRDRLLTPDEFEGNYDPHVWFDVTMWMSATERMRDALIEMDPTHAETYRANAADYLKQLAELDDYVKTQAATLPPEKRVIITAHDAFNYFSRAYGFEVRGLQGISTASEAGTADVKGLANFIVERKIPAIFIESSVPVRNVEAVQEAVRAQGWDVQIGGELFSDAMGTPGTPEGTYIGMVKHNIDTVVEALSVTSEK
ncbi:MAG: zinc ABC transporter solute-binding protein [Chloroflexi bacterium]|nr:zinc ABC transporter solute-binding protein [Chloroflexota bacterium]